MKKIVIDLFCGAGGESCGIHQAFDERGEEIKLYAVNHWERACETHSRNFPADECVCQDITAMIPTNLVGRNEEVELLWASPSCTHFSTARGGKPMDDQSRCTPFNILEWATELNVKRVIVENVPEFTTWGPLDSRTMRPVKEERGAYFSMFVNALRAIGYDVDWRVLNAADFGAPTTRKRLFIQAVKRNSGKNIAWPTPLYAENPEMFNDSLFENDLRRWIPAAEIIDWTIPCQPIEERRKPLAPATMKRIMSGIRKYWGTDAEPFLVRYNGGNNRFHSIKAPVPTFDTSNRYGLVQPLIAEMYGTGGCRPIRKPLTTVSCSGAHHAIVQPMILPQQSGAISRPVDKPCPTVATAGAIGVVEPLLMEYYGNGQCFPVRKPLGTVTCKDRFALLSPENCRIGFRMLQPHELARAQSFPSWYKFTGTKTEVVKQIGNAVCPVVAKALVG